MAKSAKQSKPTIFISHINEEKEIANALKNFLDKKFLRSATIFVSSHEESLKLGDDWFDTIRASMKHCQLMILLCSPISVNRQWINFEAGAGWLKEIPVIPLCHSGMEPGRLPIPISRFQGAMLNNFADAGRLFGRMAEILKMEMPEIEQGEFLKAITEYENKIEHSKLISDVKFVNNVLRSVVDVLKMLVFHCTSDKWNDTETIANIINGPYEYSFEFSSIYNCFRASRFSLHRRQKCFEAYYEYLQKLKDEIRFLLTYKSVDMPKELLELFHQFLGVVDLGVLWFWSFMEFNEEMYPKAAAAIKGVKIDDSKAVSLIEKEFKLSLRSFFMSLQFCSSWLKEFDAYMRMTIPDDLDKI